MQSANAGWRRRLSQGMLPASLFDMKFVSSEQPTATKLDTPDRQRSTFQAWRRFLAIPELGILLPLIGFTALFYALNPVLLSANNVAAMLRSMSFVGVIAVGMTLLMIAGELDLSVG